MTKETRINANVLHIQGNGPSPDFNPVVLAAIRRVGLDPALVSEEYHYFKSDGDDYIIVEVIVPLKPEGESPESKHDDDQ